MRIGITEWKSRVSPVFDVAARMLIVDIQDGNVTKRWYLAIPEGHPMVKVQALSGSDVSIVICGACSGSVEDFLWSSGIEVIAWVSGDVEKVLAAYIAGSRIQEEYPMPGCRGCGRRRQGRGRRRERRNQ